MEVKFFLERGMVTNLRSLGKRIKLAIAYRWWLDPQEVALGKISLAWELASMMLVGM